MIACIIPPVDMTARASTSGYEIVSYARQYIGCQYKLGATGPKVFDCAGFVSYVYKHFGVDLPKNASAYFYNPTKYGTVVGKGSIANAQMGDVIAWEGHVAIYTEGDYCVEALGTKYGVCESVRVNRHTNGMNYKVIRINGVKTVSDPKISLLSNTASGVEIKWGKVTNAENYRVFRLTSDGKWKKLADTTSTSYVDKKVEDGKTYTYTVRCVSKDGETYKSGYDDVGKSIKFLSAPTLKSVSNTETGVKISWGKVSGAAKYRIFYKAKGSGGWTKIADTDSTSYIWTKAESSTKYTFTVRCVSGDGKSYTSGFDSKGKSITYIAAPKVSSVSRTNSGFEIKWGKVTGAAKYRVFRSINGGAWEKVTDTTSTSCVDTDIQNGKKYTYVVRCVSKDGKKYSSAYIASGKSIKGTATPKISSVTNTAKGIQLSWDKVSGAEQYRVYYKTSSDGWKKICDTASSSYTWTGAQSGTKYKFTVRCLASDEKTFTSGYDTVGTSIDYIATPKLTSIYADGDGTTVKWEKVNGAENYKVLRKTADGSWEKIANTTSTGYTDNTAKLKSNYYYTVRCLSEDGKTYVSSYNGTGIMAVAEPKISSVSKESTGISISWSRVSGAEKYRVLYKANGESSWHKVVDTDATSYVWTKAKSDTTYTFTVRCISDDGTAYTSTFDNTGKSIKYIAAPKLKSVSNTETGVEIKWGKVNGAEKYRIFYKTGTGNWKRLDDTSSNSYVWKNAKSGTKYSFTVRCISKDGKSYTSAYDDTGKSVTYIAAPKNISLSKTFLGVKISWSKVAGAENYKVFRKTGDGNWKLVGTTTSTSFADNTAKWGNKYTYTVRCVSKDGKTYTSSFDSKGKTIKR